MGTVKYPIGIQSFEDIRTGGWLYIDKTEYVHSLVDNGKYYFLSRPRRFGKSLLISTLEAYFEGKRHLFKGLAIDTLTESWDSHPVFHIDLNAKNYRSTRDLVDMLNYHLEGWEQRYGSEMHDRSPEERFAWVIRKARTETGRQVVILVDEYDKPLLASDVTPGVAGEMRELMKAFYGVLKSRDADIRFAIVTGVTKFSKVSIFSDLNNLEDITLDNRYASICGITSVELTNGFAEGISRMASGYGISQGECIAMLRDNYDGYHFSSSLTDIYNPFSLLNSLAKGEIGSYWFETGTPTFLAKMISSGGIELSALEREEVRADRMQNLDLLSDDPIPVLFQSGYLTIKAYDRAFREYTLGYPNREVKEGFLRFLLPLYTPVSGNRTVFDIKRFVKEIEQGRPDDFMRRLSSLFSVYPYDMISDCELHYHNVIYLTMTLMGFYVRTEYRISSGRCDAVVETEDYVYIFEFKYDRSAAEALAQIETGRYAAPYVADSRKVFRIGVNFSSAIRSIDGYLIVPGA